MALTDNLVAYWSLDEATGQRNDLVGSNHLTDNGGVGQAAGKVGAAAQFVRALSQYLSHSDNSDLSTGDIDFTLQAWVYLDSKPAGSQMRAVCKYPSSTAAQEYALLYYTSGDRFEFAVTNTSSSVGFVDASTFGAPSTGQWYLIHAWHDSVNNQLGIAVNAGAPDTASWSSGVRDSTTEFLIGARASDHDFRWDGRIDEVGLWKRVLTGAERSELYNGGAGLAYPFTAGAGPARRRRPRPAVIEPAFEPSW